MKFQGAEAVIEFTGNKAVKKREPKTYRHPEIDSKIREERTDREVRLLKKARKYNVSVPEVTEVSENSFEMEKLEGEKLRDNLNPDHFLELGKQVSKLHETNIIHGDLTTSNVIVSDNLMLIDFGLSFQSERVEDKAVDIHLLKQVLESSHSERSAELWSTFLDGYKEMDNSEEVLEQLEEVEQRGRYK